MTELYNVLALHVSYFSHWLQVEMEAKDTQLQQKDTQLQQKDVQLQQKDGQIQRQATELRERTLRQQRELQMLRVRERIFHIWRESDFTHPCSGY